jgi:hypothetical protein
MWVYINETQWSVHELLYAGRRSYVFKIKHSDIDDAPPLESCTPIDVLTNTEQTIITSTSAHKVHHIEKSLAQSFTERIRRNKNTLLHDINLIADETTIKKVLSNKTFIDIASDGSHDNIKGTMAFGWVIALNGSVIATGQGPAAAHPSMAGSLRAESYGMASAAKFIDEFIAYFNIKIRQHAWYIYLDNSSLIRRLEAFQDENELPKWNLDPEADIIKPAAKLIHPLNASIIHVKAHQTSSKSSKKRSLAAELNAMADDLAVSFREQMKRPLTTVSGHGNK